MLHAGGRPDQGGPSAAGELGLGVHGGLQETAMILHLHPEMVEMNLAVRSVPDLPATSASVRQVGELRLAQ